MISTVESEKCKSSAGNLCQRLRAFSSNFENKYQEKRSSSRFLQWRNTFLDPHRISCGFLWERNFQPTVEVQISILELQFHRGNSHFSPERPKRYRTETSAAATSGPSGVTGRPGSLWESGHFFRFFFYLGHNYTLAKVESDVEKGVLDI